MHNEKILTLVKIEDLTEPMKLVAETCGIETAIKLIDSLGGLEIIIPQAQSLSGAVNRYILKHITQSPQKIAYDLRMSESSVKMKIKLVFNSCDVDD